MPTPTLEELLERLRAPHRSKAMLQELVRRIAAGEREPNKPPLPDSTVIFLCQALTILFQHVNDEQARNN